MPTDVSRCSKRRVQKLVLFNDLVSEPEYRRRHFEAERLGRLMIYDEFECARLPNR